MSSNKAPMPTATGSDDVAIRVEGVSKSYPLWSSPEARMRYALLGAAQRLVPGGTDLRQKISTKRGSMYREFKALEDVSLEIKKGESWGVIGVNGSGKSTLLKIIAGNLRPSAGRIEVDGKVGRLDYSSGLNGDFTGRENIYLKAAIMGMSRRDIDARYDSIVDFAEIGDFIDQPVKTYSSGMQARLGFGIIAHMETDILISDEALAVGDAFFVQKCMDYIRRFLKKGTFLFVTHSTNDVVSLCQKAVWLEHGHIKKIGAAKDVAEAYLASESLSSSQRFTRNKQASLVDSSSQPADEKTPQPSSTERRELEGKELATAKDARTVRTIRDQRRELINSSSLRNDIEIPVIDMDTGFGVGGAKIEEVALEDREHGAFSWVLGGEDVRLRILVRAEQDLETPIVGFQVLDRLGQTLFADNTYLTTLSDPLSIKKGTLISAEFDFQMPLLPVGEYAVRAAIVDGSESEAAMLHCIQTALVFRSQTSGARHGLIGIPMERISIGISDVEPMSRAEKEKNEA